MHVQKSPFIFDSKILLELLELQFDSLIEKKISLVKVGVVKNQQHFSLNICVAPAYRHEPKMPFTVTRLVKNCKMKYCSCSLEE